MKCVKCGVDKQITYGVYNVGEVCPDCYNGGKPIKIFRPPNPYWEEQEDTKETLIVRISCIEKQLEYLKKRLRDG